MHHAHFRLADVRSGRLHEKGALGVVRLLGTHVLHPSLPVPPQEVEAKAVRLLVNRIRQTFPQFRPFLRVHKAFEKRKLNTLPTVLTELCDAMQPPLTGRRGLLYWPVVRISQAMKLDHVHPSHEPEPK